MKLDFEKVLNNNGLKIGDKVKFTATGKTYEIFRNNDNRIVLRDEDNVRFTITKLQEDFEKIETKKKVGEMVCARYTCECCPMICLNCLGNIGLTIRERLNVTITKYPHLEPLRAYFEKELNEEVSDEH